MSRRPQRRIIITAIRISWSVRRMIRVLSNESSKDIAVDEQVAKQAPGTISGARDAATCGPCMAASPSDTAHRGHQRTANHLSQQSFHGCGLATPPSDRKLSKLFSRCLESSRGWARPHRGPSYCWETESPLEFKFYLRLLPPFL